MYNLFSRYISKTIKMTSASDDSSDDNFYGEYSNV